MEIQIEKLDINKILSEKLPQFKIFEFFNLQTTIDYCNLHQTTRDESYRITALDNFRNYNQIIKVYNSFLPQIAKEFYPVIVKKFGLNKTKPNDENEKKFNNYLKKILNKSKNTANVEEINQWREYCLNCRFPDDKACKKSREKLINFQKNTRTNLEDIFNDSIKMVKILIENPYLF
ncbi:MAG: hypothetical protein KJ646_03830 [Nanoarchaeota archaeon]|nr:hypothetical protein [Nanoarchaeota archaeon]MBU4116130.1 hypothetical protein [Nanoarchaeota archaeon]